LFTEMPGEHCERCLAAVEKDFHHNRCRMFHENEYLCPKCVEYIEAKIPKLITYLKEYGGCLFQELRFGEERLNIKIVR
jgi:hypothetical protein